MIWTSPALEKTTTKYVEHFQTLVADINASLGCVDQVRGMGEEGNLLIGEGEGISCIDFIVIAGEVRGRRQKVCRLIEAGIGSFGLDDAAEVDAAAEVDDGRYLSHVVCMCW